MLHHPIARRQGINLADVHPDLPLMPQLRALAASVERRRRLHRKLAALTLALALALSLPLLTMHQHPVKHQQLTLHQRPGK